MSLVGLVRAYESNLDSFQRAIERSLDLIQFNFKRKPKKVAIKPNLCYYFDYSTGETTDPKFVSALINVLRKRLSSNLEIFVVESDASAMRCNYAFKILGYEKMAKKKGVKLVNLSKERNKQIEVRTEDTWCRFCVPKTISEADLLVNVPKIKYAHASVKITCSLKNIYGCNAYPKKSIYHTALDESIVGINKVIKSQLIVVDGIIVKGMNTKRLGLVMASTDPVAIDAAASKIAGLNHQSVRHIALASREGIGNAHFIPKGESLTYFKKRFPRKDIKSKIRESIVSSYQRFFGEEAS